MEDLSRQEIKEIIADSKRADYPDCECGDKMIPRVVKHDAFGAEKSHTEYTCHGCGRFFIG